MILYDRINYFTLLHFQHYHQSQTVNVNSPETNRRHFFFIVPYLVPLFLIIVRKKTSKFLLYNSMMVQTYKNMLHSFSSAGVNINIPPRWGAHVGVPPAAPAVCLMLLCPVITLDHGGRWLSRFLYWHHVLDAVTAAVVRSISQSCECRDHPVFVFFFGYFYKTSHWRGNIERPRLWLLNSTGVWGCQQLSQAQVKPRPPVPDSTAPEEERARLCLPIVLPRSHKELWCPVEAVQVSASCRFARKKRVVGANSLSPDI